jgi:hypothetical protein
MAIKALAPLESVRPATGPDRLPGAGYGGDTSTYQQANAPLTTTNRPVRSPGRASLARGDAPGVAVLAQYRADLTRAANIGAGQWPRAASECAVEEILNP